MRYEKSTLSIADRRRLENLEAQAETNAANIDYVAMMCDVDMPNEDGGEVSEDGE